MTILGLVGRDGIAADTSGSWPLPALLRGARTALGSVIRRELAAAGYEDVPPNGLFVLGAIAGAEVPFAEVIATLGVSKQTAGALVDRLVVRGYLDRRSDCADRRRIVVSLTDRGAEAARMIRHAAAELELSLEAAVGSEAVAHARLTLAALIFLGHADA
jgi:DNA-binding MarR family transcriptional regulator